MPKTLLTGTLDEQCVFLMDLAQQKMSSGNYTGAVHALREIQKYAPDYPGLKELLVRAERGKKEQRVLLFAGFAGAIIAVFAGTWWGVPNDIWFLGLAVGGALIGYLTGLALVGRKSARSSTASGSAKQGRSS